MKKNVPSAVIKRLPRYQRYLRELLEAGVTRISSAALSEKMQVTASQIRQDFNHFGGFGQQGYGYSTELLRERIGGILRGGSQNYTAILIGVGNLGRALCENFNFAAAGVTLSAAFDIRPELFGVRVGGVDIRTVDTLDEYVSVHRPDLAVLTLPRPAAADMARRLGVLGVRGLWNFTNEELHQAAGQMVVENIHFFDSLMFMCYHLGEQQPEAKGMA